jgi:MFS family permease
VRYPIFLAALGLGQLVSWAILYYAFSAFVLPMQAELGWSKALITGGFSVGLAMWGVGSYAVGAGIDRGRGRAVMTGGAALGGLGLLLWSVAMTPAVYIAVWGLLGLAMAATLYEPAFTILTRRHPGRYRQGITILTLIGGFASTLAFPAAAWLLSLTDWRGALVVLGLVQLLAVAPLHLVTLRGADALEPGPTGTPGTAADLSLAEARRTTAFWLIAAAFAIHLFLSAGLWAHIVPALDAKGLGGNVALTVLMVIGPAQVLGRLVYMLAGTHLASRHVGAAVLAGVALSFAILATSVAAWQAVVFGLVFGAANGLMSVMRGSILPDYFGRRSLGRIAGAINLPAVAARSLGPLAIGAALPAVGGYAPVMWGLCLLGLVAAGCVAAARPPGPD